MQAHIGVVGKISQRLGIKENNVVTSGAMGLDAILQRRHANIHLRVWDLEPTRRLYRLIAATCKDLILAVEREE